MQKDSCHCYIEVIGAEYHYNLDDQIPDIFFKYFLHFLQKTLSIILMLIYTFYFLRKKKLIGTENMLNETVLQNLDGIIDELIEEAKESTSIFYNQALKIYKKRIKDDEKEKERKEFFSQNENSPKNLYLKKYQSHSIYLNKAKKLQNNMTRSKTNFSLSNLIDYYPRNSSRDELISNKEREIECAHERKGSTQFIEVEQEKIIEEIHENPSLNEEPGTIVKYKERIDSNTINLNPSLDIYRNFYICNCYECCCECCCDWWFRSIFYSLYSIYLKFKQKTLIFLIKNSKMLCFCFIIVGVFFEMALRNAFSILVSDCLKIELGHYFTIIFVLFSIVDFVCGAAFFFANVFLFSFLSTRREFLAVNPSDKRSRGRIIFYHLSKGFLYGFLHFVFQLFFRAIFLFYRPFFEVDEGSDTAIFSLLKNSFFFLFILHNYNNWKSTVLIQEDCDILKFQNRYFAIQNTFLKFLPNQNTLLKFIKVYFHGKNQSSDSFMSVDTPTNNKEVLINSIEKRSFLNSLNKDLEMNLLYLKMQLNEQLNIVEKQKFKRILRNRGLYPMLQVTVIYFMFLSSFVYMIICGACLIKMNTSFVYSDTTYHLLYIAIFLLNISEITVIPLMFKYSLEQRFYLDYETGTPEKWNREEYI